MTDYFRKISGGEYRAIVLGLLLLFTVTGMIFGLLTIEKPPIDIEYYIERGDVKLGIKGLAESESIEWEKTQSSELNFGQENDPVWVRIPGKYFKDGINIIDIKFRQLDNVSMFVVDAQTNIYIDDAVSGDRHKYVDRSLSTEKILFKVEKPNNTDIVVYLRSQTKGANYLPIHIYSLDEYLESTDYIGLMVMLFIGFAVITIINNFMWFATYRLKSNLYYNVAIAGLVLMISYHYRIPNIIFPDVPIKTQHNMVLIGMVIAFFGGTEIMRSMFYEWSVLNYNKILKAVSFFSIFVMVVSLIIDYDKALWMLYAYLAIAGATLIIMPIHLIMTNKAEKYIGSAFTLLFSWVFFLGGAFMQMSIEFGWISNEYVGSNSILLGSLGIIMCSQIVISNNLEIARRKALETEKSLKHAQALVYRADRAQTISSMSQGLIHELKNPLGWTKSSLIKGMKYMDMEDQVERRNAAFKRTESGIDKIQAIIDGLNMFIANNRIDRMDYFDPKISIDRILKLSRGTANGISIKVEREKGTFIYGSETHFSQIIMNLFTNAVKAINKHEGVDGKITISVASSKDRSSTILTFTDNGIGMSEDERQNVFKLFYSTEPNESEVRGLGMAIVSEIVSLHNAEITVESEKGVGTTFSIRFESHGPKHKKF